MTIIEQVAQYLEDNGIGTVATDIFLTQKPSTIESGNVVVIYDRGGQARDTDIHDIAFPDFQIYVRNESYVDGRAKIDEIAALLHGKANLKLVSGEVTYYDWILMNGEPVHIGSDEQEREEFSVNFTARIKLNG